MSFVSGFHAIEELLSRETVNREGGMTLHVAEHPGPRVRKLMDLASAAGVPIRNSRAADLSAKSGTADHRGLLLEVRPTVLAESPGKHGYEDALADLSERTALADSAGRKPLIVFLDSITDPHNIGAIIRSADQFNADFVVLPERRSGGDGDTVLKTSAGASSWVPTYRVTNLSRALGLARESGFWVCGADMAGNPIDRVSANRPIALVMGNEGKGLGRLVSERCDELVSIPSRGRVDSLNVSVATGILLYEIRRQQNFI